MADKATSGEDYADEYDPRTGMVRKTLRSDPTKKKFFDPSTERSTGLGALVKALAEKRKKKEKESLGSSEAKPKKSSSHGSSSGYLG